MSAKIPIDREQMASLCHLFGARQKRMIVCLTAFIVLGSGCSFIENAREVYYLHRALKYARDGRFQEAKEAFVAMAPKDPADRQKCEVYLEIIEDASKKNIDKETAIHLFRAMEAFDKERYDESIAEGKQALAINPNYDEVHYFLALNYSKKGMSDEAVAEYKKITEINPGHVDAHVSLGTIYLKREMLNEAISEYQKALDLKADSPGLHYNLAVAYTMKGQYDLAIKHCDRAVDLGCKVDPKLLEDLRPHRKQGG